MERIKLPCGNSDFTSIRRSGQLYIDKSDAIVDLVTEGGRAIQFTRPMGFGKTCFLTMLKSFFSLNAVDSSDFDGLAVMKESDVVGLHMHRYPVIHLPLGTVTGKNAEEMVKKLTAAISNLYKNNCHLLDGTLSRPQQLYFLKALEGFLDKDSLPLALRELVSMLSDQHESPVLVLIDDFDKPLSSAARHGCFDSVSPLITDLIGKVIEEDGLFKLCIAGVYPFPMSSRYSIEGQDSGLCSKAFGFTDGEVESILAQTGLEDSAEEMDAFCGGYNFGGMRTHHPKALFAKICEYMESGVVNVGELVDTDQIAYLLDQQSITGELSASALATLASSGQSAASISSHFSYKSASEQMVLTRLIALGALAHLNPEDDAVAAELCIPNTLSRKAFEAAALKWMPHWASRQNRKPLFDALWKADAPSLETALQASIRNMIHCTCMRSMLACLLVKIGYVVEVIASPSASRPDIIVKDPMSNRAAIIKIEKAESPEEREETAAYALSLVPGRGCLTAVKSTATVLAYGLAYDEEGISIRVKGIPA